MAETSDVLGGAAGGAAAGSSFGPWGALIGAGGGALLSLLGSEDQSAGIEAQIQGQKDMLQMQFDQNKISRDEYAQKMEEIYSPLKQELGELYAPFSGLAQEGINDMKSGSAPVREDFTYDKSVEDFLDPSIDYQVGEATKAVNASGAATGSMLSGAAQKAIADRAQSIGAKGYVDADARMRADRAYEQNKQYTEYGMDVDAAATDYTKASNLASLGLNSIDKTAEGLKYATTGIAGGQLTPQNAPLLPTSAGLSQIQSGKTKQALGGQLIDLGGQYLANQYGR